MLTIDGSNWLAINAGVGNCFASSGINYTSIDGLPHTGRTGDIVNAFYTAFLTGIYDPPIIANTNYTQFRIINGNNDLTLTDVDWAYANDGGTGSTSIYCIPTPTPSPTPSPTPTIIPPTPSPTPPMDICSWIVQNGGIPMPISNISILVEAYLGFIDIGFTVTIGDILGIVTYYLGYITSGNSFTGCNF